jgi:fucose 4-O-acetylase-like acetyltransferase
MDKNIIKKRDDYFDNAKFFLIVLVIIGHQEVESAFQAEWMTPVFLRNFIYAFHMPMFVLISGYFSKKTTTSNLISNNFIKLIIPFIIFQILFSFYYNIIGSPLKNFISPWYAAYGLWYLPSLFIWRISSPLFSNAKHPIFIAILLGVTSGYIQFMGHFLCLGRIFGFWPFFIIGYSLNSKFFAIIRSTRIKLISVLILCASLVFSFEFLDGRYVPWLYYGFPYSFYMNHEYLIFGGFIRILSYVIALILGFSFLSIVNSGKSIFTYCGKYSIYPYLLHMFFISILAIKVQYIGFLFISNSKYVSQILLIMWNSLIAVSLTLMLSSSPVRRLFGMIVEPIDCIDSIRKGLEKLSKAY